MKPEEIIKNSIKEAQQAGIKIIRGPIFIWGHGSIPEACDFSGAVLFAHNKAKPNFPPGWLRELCIDILKKDTWWWYRFNFGFSQARPLKVMKIIIEQGKKKEIWVDEEVSLDGARLAKKLGLISKS